MLEGCFYCISDLKNVAFVSTWTLVLMFVISEDLKKKHSWSIIQISYFVLYWEKNHVSLE